MKLLFISIFFLVSLLSNLAYSQNEKKCSYQVNDQTLKLNWVAFKTMQKVAVKGHFTNFEINANKKPMTLKNFIKSIKIKVDKSKVETGDAGRNATLAEFFFAKLKNQISGEVKSVSEVDKSFIVQIKMNNTIQNVTFNYTIDENLNFSAAGNIDVLKFKATSALESLNQKCYELHKGPDGVSKTWSEVDLNFTGQLLKTCN